METRRMCPHCRAFITTKDRVCPYCEAEVGPKAAERRDPGGIMGGLIQQQRFVTSIILFINVVLYGLSALYGIQSGRGASWMDIDGQTLMQFGAKTRYHIFAEGEYWRLITAGFLHGGAIHILMNSWNLLDLGSQAEEVFGGARMWVIYLAGTVTGFMASALWSPSISIGASAGLCSVLGAMIAWGFREKTHAATALRGMYVRWAIILLAIGLLPFPIDTAAHLGGLIGGFLTALVAGTPKLRGGAVERFWQGAAILATTITVVAFYKWFVSSGILT